MELIKIIEPKTKKPIRRFVDENIYGRCTMYDIDGDFIVTAVSLCPGDHLEIGVAHGGSSIIAAYAKMRANTEGHIYGIDPFPGYELDRSHYPPPPTIGAAQNNINLHGLTDRISLYQGFHPPLPKELEDKRFTTAFIDGNHSLEAVLADWLYLKDRVDGIVLFHDIQNKNFGCREVFEVATADPEWEFLAQGGKMGLVKRVGYKFQEIEDGG